MSTNNVNLNTKCFLCNESKITKTKTYEATNLIQCSNCKFVFDERIPSIQELTDHYDGYDRKHYLSPITIKRYHQILDTLEKYKKTKRLIDVGCGTGSFLVVAKERGWDVYGTEFSQEAVDVCEKNGIKMEIGPLNPSNYDAGFFDVITSFEVIEHINNPQEEVGNFNKILRKDGCVYITTPNYNSISGKMLKESWNIIAYPDHLSYYTPRTLDYIFNKNGFRMENNQTTGISLSRLKESMSNDDHKNRQKLKKEESTNQVKKLDEKSLDEKLRNKMESSSLLGFGKKSLNFILNSFKIGDAMKAYYIKK